MNRKEAFIFTTVVIGLVILTVIAFKNAEGPFDYRGDHGRIEKTGIQLH